MSAAANNRAREYAPQTVEEIETAVRDMAVAGYTVLVISQALSVHVEYVKAILAIDACE
jgi:phosphoserine phosphatase